MTRLTRLEKLLFRLEAQYLCLAWAFKEVAGGRGAVFELGLGHGRTYDHMRQNLPGRDIYVFERDLDCFDDCVPPDDRLFLGDIGDTLAASARRFPRQVVLAHCDVGSYTTAHNEAMSGLLEASGCPRSSRRRQSSCRTCRSICRTPMRYLYRPARATAGTLSIAPDPAFMADVDPYQADLTLHHRQMVVRALVEPVLDDLGDVAEATPASKCGLLFDGGARSGNALSAAANFSVLRLLGQEHLDHAEFGPRAGRGSVVPAAAPRAAR